RSDVANDVPSSNPSGLHPSSGQVRPTGRAYDSSGVRSRSVGSVRVARSVVGVRVSGVVVAVIDGVDVNCCSAVGGGAVISVVIAGIGGVLYLAEVAMDRVV